MFAIVPHWRTPRLTSRCVEALGAQCTPGVGFELQILVVDNGSHDLPPLLAAGRASLQILRLEENIGFAGGCNAGLREACRVVPDYIFLLNSDALVRPGCIERLLSVAGTQEGPVAVGPALLDGTGTRIESLGHGFSRYTGRHREHLAGLPASSLPSLPREADSLSAAALLIRRDALDRAGWFDQGFFLYFEDMDWCLRARNAGVRLLAVPSAHVWHAGSASIGRDVPLITFYSVRNHLRVVRRHCAPAWRILASGFVVAAHLAYVLRGTHRRSAAHLQALAGGVRAGLAPTTA